MRFSFRAGLPVAILFVTPIVSRADSVTVGCPGGSPGQFQSITAALAQLDPRGPNTITVSGACAENITISSFDRLSLIGQAGASVTDNSGGTAAVITVSDSQRISIQGFTINGGISGIRCWDHSLCRFSGNTIQDSKGSGVVVAYSSANFSGDTIQNNPGGGVGISPASQVRMDGVTIRGNGSFAAVAAGSLSYLEIRAATIQNNQGHGVLLEGNSTMNLRRSNISSNGGNGIEANGNSAVAVTDSTISLNGGYGVLVHNLSLALFGPGPNQIVTGNKASLDVACNPQFSVGRGTQTNIGGGRSNCTEPE